MSAEVIYLDDYREPLSPERRQHLRERLADLAIEICLLESEKKRVEQLLKEEL